MHWFPKNIGLNINFFISMFLLEVKDLVKGFEQNGTLIKVLDKISFVLDENDFVCIIGPSGCGKTLLLKMIMGIEPTDEGLILFKGSPIREAYDLKKGGITFVPQEHCLLPWLNVTENVEIGLESKGIPKKERREISLSFIQEVGLAGYEEAYPRELSSGMKKRVSIARALVTEPELLIMDEPFSNLDNLTSIALREELIMLWKDKTVPLKSILMVSHSVEESVLLADRVLIFSKSPAHIIDEVKIELPRPRNPKDVNCSAYMDKIFEIIL